MAIEKKLGEYLRLAEKSPDHMPLTAQAATNYALTHLERKEIMMWLWSNCEQIVKSRYTTLLSGQRRAVRSQAKAMFSGSTQPSQEELADLKARAFKHVMSVPDGNGGYIQVRAGETTAEDHRRIAEKLRDTANSSLFKAVLHEKIAARIGPSTVAEVYDPVEFAKLLAGLDNNGDPIDGDHH